jgi:hypothetical protein
MLYFFIVSIPMMHPSGLSFDIRTGIFIRCVSSPTSNSIVISSTTLDSKHLMSSPLHTMIVSFALRRWCVPPSIRNVSALIKSPASDPLSSSASVLTTRAFAAIGLALADLWRWPLAGLVG